MKKLYTKPNADIKLFVALDVLTISAEEQFISAGDNLGNNSDFKLGNSL